MIFGYIYSISSGRFYFRTYTCNEILSPSGEKVFLISGDELNQIKENGLNIPTENVEWKLNNWLKNHPKDKDYEQQVMAAKAIMGDHSFIVPLLAGLKPAGQNRNMNYRNVTTKGSQERTDCFEYFCQMGVLDRIDSPNAYYSMYFNPEAVKSASRDLKGKSTNPRDLIRTIMEGDDDSSTGLMLGFDEYSTTHYNTATSMSAPGFPINLWGVEYRVADIKSNPQYAQLREKYDAIYKEIENQLSQGASPLEALQSIINFFNNY